MRQRVKARLAVFLSVLLILPTVISVLPMASREVSAASSYTSMYWSWSNRTVQVEKGQKFYVGDYVNVYTSDSKGNSWSKTASMVKASYKSSQTSVASVNKKGYVTAKKEGTTTITVKYSGQTVKAKLKVVAKGKIPVPKEAAKVKKQALSLAKQVPTKITTKNGYKLLKAANDYDTAQKNCDRIGSSGFLKEKKTSSFGNYTYYVEGNKLAVPQAGRWVTLNHMLNEYVQKNSPTSTRSAKMLKIKSASATTSSITLKLSKKIEASQILAAQISFSGMNQDIKGSSKAYVYLYFYDAKGKYYQGRVELKKGSATVKITPQVYSSSGYVDTKLTKGVTYTLGTKNDWAKGKKVKVK